MRRIAEGTAQAYSVVAEVSYTRQFVPLINDAALVDEALAAARMVLAGDAVRIAADDAAGIAAEPMTASEDFARFLRVWMLRPHGQWHSPAAQPGL